MTGPKTLGQMANAPLAYVLAQVRFNLVLDMDKRIPDVQAALRERYPRFNIVQGLSVSVPSQGAVQVPAIVQQWAFANDANRKGAILQANSLVYHVTEYTTYPEFGASLFDVMKIVTNVIPNLFVERLGLRYVDFIVPRPGESASMYVKDSLRCDPNPGLEFKSLRGITFIDYELELGRLHIKFFTGRNLSALPPDLEPLILEKSAVMNQRPTEGTAVGLLDTDRFIEIAQRFDPESLMARFNMLHDDITTAYKALASNHAFEVWTGQRAT